MKNTKANKKRRSNYKKIQKRRKNNLEKYYKMKNIDNYSQSCDSSNVIINEYGNDNDDSIKKMKTPNSNFKMFDDLLKLWQIAKENNNRNKNNNINKEDNNSSNSYGGSSRND